MRPTQHTAASTSPSGPHVGRVVLTPQEAEEVAAPGEKVKQVRNETSPEAQGGKDAAEGVQTVLSSRRPTVAESVRPEGGHQQ